MSLGRALLRHHRILQSTLWTEHVFTCTRLPVPFLNVTRGVKTTDTIHPKPIYDDDERILKKVLEEREKQSEDMPVGMGNPYEKPRKYCILCDLGISPNYKNIKLLYQFVSPYTGRLYERHITGLCAPKYEQLVKEYRIAVTMGLMSNYLKEVDFLKDPQICDPERPILPHKYT